MSFGRKGFPVIPVLILAVISCAPAVDNTAHQEDQTPPVLTISSPADGVEVGGPYILRGYASDAGSGIKAVYVKVDGGNYTPVSMSGSNWSTNISIAAYGAHTNYVYAEDIAGLKSEVKSVWILRGAFPVLEVLSPLSGTYTNTSNIQVKGTSSIDAPYNITSVEVKLNAGGWITAAGISSWSNIIALADGSNSIYVRAIADNGKTNTLPAISIILDKTVYVALSGSDGNFGTLKSPLLTIQAGVNKAKALGIDTVKVAVGDYIPGTGLNVSGNGITLNNTTGLKLYGGYSTNFTARSGYSGLNGMYTLKHVVWFENATNTLLDGFYIYWGNASGAGADGAGGGIYIKNSAGIIVSNSMIATNGANEVGGGIYITNGVNHVIHGTIAANNAGNAGGIYICYGSNHTISGTVAGSNTGFNSGGVYIKGGFAHKISGTVSGNYASAGAGVYLDNGTNFLINGTISDNHGYTAGGMWVYGGLNNTISGTISGNTANSGGGIWVYAGVGHIFSGTVSNNTADSSGGGFYTFQGVGLTFSGTIAWNTSVSNGGGIYMYNPGPGFSFSGLIKANSKYGITTNSGLAQNFSGVTWGTGAETNKPANVGQ
jgi:hypothetical protein